jgi:hypothetical protein
VLLYNSAMKLSTPEIVWHSKEPIFTADFHNNGPMWRLATGGGDNDVKVCIISLWRMWCAAGGHCYGGRLIIIIKWVCH